MFVAPANPTERHVVSLSSHQLQETVKELLETLVIDSCCDQPNAMKLSIFVALILPNSGRQLKRKIVSELAL